MQFGVADVSVGIRVYALTDDLQDFSRDVASRNEGGRIDATITAREALELLK